MCMCLFICYSPSLPPPTPVVPELLGAFTAAVCVCDNDNDDDDRAACTVHTCRYRYSKLLP